MIGRRWGRRDDIILPLSSETKRRSLFYSDNTVLVFVCRVWCDVEVLVDRRAALYYITMTSTSLADIVTSNNKENVAICVRGRRIRVCL